MSLRLLVYRSHIKQKGFHHWNCRQQKHISRSCCRVKTSAHQKVHGPAQSTSYLRKTWINGGFMVTIAASMHIPRRTNIQSQISWTSTKVWQAVRCSLLLTSKEPTTTSQLHQTILRKQQSSHYLVCTSTLSCHLTSRTLPRPSNVLSIVSCVTYHLFMSTLMTFSLFLGP